MKKSKLKVLIITYYWPPAGGVVVQRWLKFVKYLNYFGVEPVLFTPKNPSYPVVDESLENELPEDLKMLTYPIFEPNQFLFSKTKKQSGGLLKSRKGFLSSLALYVRANLFIPDTRKFWIKPSVKYLKNYLRNNPIDVIITTGPPHSVHLIGKKLKELLAVKWLADFRDPWTKIDYFHHLPLTKKALRKHVRMENDVISSADATVVVGETMKRDFEKLNSNTFVITNGYDTEEFHAIKELDKNFTIAHTGMMNSDRNPRLLWKVLKQLCDEYPDFSNDLRIKLIGGLSSEVEENLKVFDKEQLELIDFVSHEEVSSYQQSAQLLLLIINNVSSAKGIITGKIFEYLQAKRPILGIGPVDGDAAEIIKNTNSGVCIDFNDKESLKKQILIFYKEYKKGTLHLNQSEINQYHRKELTRKLVEVLETIKADS